MTYRCYNQVVEKVFGNKLAKILTKVGIILTKSGAEVHRVEDTMERICKAYGASVIDAYVTPTLLIISFSFKDQSELYHNIKRVYSSSYDLSKIDKINSLSREVCSKPIDLDLFDELLDKIDNEKSYSTWMLCLAGALCAFGFAFFYKGDLYDALVAIPVGFCTKLLTSLLEKIEFPAFFKHLLSGAFLTALSIVLATIFKVDRDIVIIASIMLLVPGLAITNAIRDSVSGDLVSGITRAIEAIFIAIAIALGSGIVLSLLGGM